MASASDGAALTTKRSISSSRAFPCGMGRAANGRPFNGPSGRTSRRLAFTPFSRLPNKGANDGVVGCPGAVALLSHECIDEFPELRDGPAARCAAARCATAASHANADRRRSTPVPRCPPAARPARPRETRRCSSGSAGCAPRWRSISRLEARADFIDEAPRLVDLGVVDFRPCASGARAPPAAPSCVRAAGRFLRRGSGRRTLRACARRSASERRADRFGNAESLPDRRGVLRCRRRRDPASMRASYGA